MFLKEFSPIKKKTLVPLSYLPELDRSTIYTKLLVKELVISLFHFTYMFFEFYTFEALPYDMTKKFKPFLSDCTYVPIFINVSSLLIVLSVLSGRTTSLSLQVHLKRNRLAFSAILNDMTISIQQSFIFFFK